MKLHSQDVALADDTGDPSSIERRSQHHRTGPDDHTVGMHEKNALARPRDCLALSQSGRAASEGRRSSDR